jgi:hypothetical protein
MTITEHINNDSNVIYLSNSFIMTLYISGNVFIYINQLDATMS